MKKKWLWGIILAVAVIVIFMVKLYHDAGEFKKIEPRCACACEKISGINGAEDVTIDAKTRTAFISADDRYASMQGRDVRGAIYTLDMNERAPLLKRTNIGFAKEFHPHGISLYRDAAGKLLLFVVNHRSDGNFIEIFEYRGGVLLHRESVSHPLMHSPNDVLAVGPRSFYATNDHGSSSPLGRTMEEYLQLARAYVVYFDGTGMKVAAEGLAYANGIAMSADGTSVYVASTVGKCVNAYRREAAGGALVLSSSVDVKTGPDNIEIDETGALWIAAHPKMLTFLKHAKNPGTPAPSQVLRIGFDAGGKAAVSELFLDDGGLLSAASVAAPLGNRFLLGCVFDDHILLCTKKDAPR